MRDKEVKPAGVGKVFSKALDDPKRWLNGFFFPFFLLKEISRACMGKFRNGKRRRFCSQFLPLVLSFPVLLIKLGYGCAIHLSRPFLLFFSIPFTKGCLAARDYKLLNDVRHIFFLF